MDRRIRLLLDFIDQSFSGSSWHGTPLWGSVRGVAAAQAHWQPGRGRHSIWEFVLHTAYWKCMVRRRLVQDWDIKFPLPGSNWPAVPERSAAALWKRDRELLKHEHQLLRHAVARFDADRLGRRGARSKWRSVQEIYGIASHDLYHAGQIQLVKRLYAQRG
ncbi:MAG: DinB family protein [Gemmatimonadales bacterium]